MSSAARPDSRILVNGSNGRHNGAATAAAGNDDSLSEFASEAGSGPQIIFVPVPPIAARIRRNDVTASATRIPSSAKAAPYRPERSKKSQPPARTPVASLLTRVRQASAPSALGLRIPSGAWQIPDLRRFATTTTLMSFAGGAAAGVLAMWFVGAQPPPLTIARTAVAPTTAQAVSPEPTQSAPPATVSAQDVRPADDTTGAMTAPRRKPIVPATTRQVGTSGRVAANPTGSTRTVRPTRVSPAPSAAPRNTAAGSQASYRGSIAFRSAPQGARVFVNGAFVGSTPLLLENLPVGSRAVRIEADGYQGWSASTQVVANQQTRVSATLGPAIP